MYLVFTTSKGEVMTVMQKPAMKTEVKWLRRLSMKRLAFRRCPYEVIGHQLTTVDNGIPHHIERGAFPKASEPFLTGNGLVGLHGRLAFLATSGPTPSLKMDLDHIYGLGHSHSQGTGGAACQEASQSFLNLSLSYNFSSKLTKSSQLIISVFPHKFSSYAQLDH